MKYSRVQEQEIAQKYREMFKDNPPPWYIARWAANNGLWNRITDAQAAAIQMGIPVKWDCIVKTTPELLWPGNDPEDQRWAAILVDAATRRISEMWNPPRGF